MCRTNANARGWCAPWAAQRRPRTSCQARRGLSLIELLIAATIMTMIVGVVAGLASAVRLSTRYTQSLATVSQHGRVTLERIGQAVRTAHATANEPGLVVVETTVDGWRFPDTLVVWRPEGAAGQFRWSAARARAGYVLSRS